MRRACKHLIIAIDGAELFVIGGKHAAASVHTPAAAWEDVFDCRSRPEPSEAPDFRGSDPPPPQKKQSKLHSTFAFFLLPLCITFERRIFHTVSHLKRRLNEEDGDESFHRCGSRLKNGAAWEGAGNQIRFTPNEVSGDGISFFLRRTAALPFKMTRADYVSAFTRRLCLRWERMPIRRRANFVYLFAQRPPFIKQLCSYVGDGTRAAALAAAFCWRLFCCCTSPRFPPSPTTTHTFTHPVNGG